MKPLQVISIAYNRPDFIALQYHSLCKYLKGPWVFLVFSDAEVNIEDNDHKIKATCKKLHVQHIRIPPYIQTIPGPSPRAGNALDWALKNYAYSYDGLTLVMDSDMFLVKTLDPISFMNDPVSEGLYDMAGVVQTMSHSGYWFRYLWMALLMINGSSMKHKNPEQIRFMNAVSVENLPTDAGGPMHYYLENHPDLKIKALKHMWSGTWTIPEVIELGYDENEPFCQYLKKEKDDHEIAGIGEMISSYFYHYRAGSNWNQLSPAVVDRRARHLQEYMHSILPTNVITGSRNWHFYTGDEISNDEISSFQERGLMKGFSKDQLKLYIDYQITEPTLMMSIDPKYPLPSLEELEELFLIHETLHNERSILSLEYHDYEETESRKYDSNLTWRLATSTKCQNFICYKRPGLLPETNTLDKEVYALDPQLWNMIFNGKPAKVPITTTLTRFPIKKQHHYQIVVIGKKLDPAITIQLVCLGDTFFGALNAKEFSLGTNLTLIKWDFYNKFETKIDIGLEVKDNRVSKAIPKDMTYQIKRAYLSCIGPLG